MNVHDAFISYSHAADRDLAPSIEKGLESLARPLLRLRAIDVFRDETSLAANPGLWSGIVSHLSASRWFLLLASPQSAASPWCNKELLWWLEHRGVECMLVLLTNGEVAWDAESGDFDWSRTTALSREVRGKFAEQPLYVDLRWARGQAKLSLTDTRFRDAILDLASPIRGVPKDQLDGEDVRQLKRNKRIVHGLQAGIAGAALIAFVFAIVAWVQREEARQQRDEAIRQARVALSQKLSSEALRTHDDHVDRALLLAVTALDVYPTADGKVSLLATLLRGRYAKFERALDGSAHRVDQVTSSCREPEAVLRQSRIPRELRDWLNTADQDLMGIGCFAASGNGGRIAALIEKRDISTAARFPARLVVWDTAERKKSVVTSVHFGEVTALSFSTDGALLVSGDSHGTLLLWRRHSGTQEWRYERLYGHTSAIRRAEFGMQQRTLITESVEGDVIHWDFRRPQSLATVLDDRRVTSVAEFGFTRIGFARGGRLVVATGSGGRLLAWEEGHEMSPARELAVVSGIPRALAVNNKGDWIAVASDQEIRVLNLDTGLVRSVSQPCKSVAGLSFSLDDGVLAFGGVRCLRLWRYQAEAEPRTVDLPELLSGRVYSTVFAADERSLILAGSFGLVTWPLLNTSVPGEPQVIYQKGLLTRVAVSRDGRLLAVGNWEGEVTLISRDDAQIKTVHLVGHRGGAITGLAFSRDGELLASSDANGTTMLWDLRRAEPLVDALKSGGVTASELAFSPDGSAFAVGSDDRVVTVWPFGVNAWRQRACAIANRNLTREEWQQHLPDQAYRLPCPPQDVAVSRR